MSVRMNGLHRKSATGAVLVVTLAACSASSSSFQAVPGADSRALGKPMNGSASGPANGTLFLADPIANIVVVFKTGSSASSPLSTVATITNGIKNPTVVATDAAGNLYVGNAGDNTIREYPNGTTSPSMTLANVVNPEGIAVDAQGNLWVSQLPSATDLVGVVDEYAYSASSKTFSSTPVKTIAGSGAATLLFPHGLAFDPTGNLFIADPGRSGVLVEVPSGSTTTTTVTLPAISNPAPSEKGRPTVMQTPYDVHIAGTGSSEMFYVSDYSYAGFYAFAPGATKPTIAFDVGDGALASGGWQTKRVTADTNGVMYFTVDAGGPGLGMYDPANGKSDGYIGSLLSPEGVAWTAASHFSNSARHHAIRAAQLITSLK
jgi:streptogramin lyase